MTRFTLALAASLALTACAPSWKDKRHDQLFQYEPPVTLLKPPPKLDTSDWWDMGSMLGVRPLARLVSPARYAKVISGGRSAQDVNAFGQIADSAWFVNRIGKRAFSTEEAFEGNAKNAGLAPGTLLVISGKIDGASAGFVIKDSLGQVWYLKLDHPGFPSISTSAEVISQRLLWLAGYRVPIMVAVDVQPDRFVLDPKARTRDGYNRSKPLTQGRLDQLLANTNPNANGLVRALISKQPPGEVMGPFQYRGRRADDPNDVLDHEQRRSLRGLWLFSAWVNNTDTRMNNTLDMFRPITPDGRGVVEHYLIDFGNSFAATGLGEKVQVEGWEYTVDWSAIFRNLFTFGLYQPKYLDIQRSKFRSVGMFEAKAFNPKKWKPALPNPAFDERTDDDLFWAASILARIQPEHIRAAVEAGHYDEEGAADYVYETLLARRRKLLEYAFEGYLEIDRPRVEGTRLLLDDLRKLAGFGPMATVNYKVEWDRTRARDVDLAKGTSAAYDANDPMSLSIELAPAIASARAKSDFADEPYITVTLSKDYGDHVAVHLRVDKDRLVPVGVDR
ncbi:MAG TPA: hypothetical protein VGM90_24475 [Kofleriaceae bacterium]|jgi:hypothetical protein